MVQECVSADLGRVKSLGNPVKLSKSPATLRKPAPRLGEDNDGLLSELGYDDGAISGLRQKGVI
jgi:crotonobetainyl-CoA:carnitine CoA-transferase CaiB-like acyl-CoA transferase